MVLTHGASEERCSDDLTIIPFHFLSYKTNMFNVAMSLHRNRLQKMPKSVRSSVTHSTAF